MLFYILLSIHRNEHINMHGLLTLKNKFLICLNYIMNLVTTALFREITVTQIFSDSYSYRNDQDFKLCRTLIYFF